MSPDDMEHIRSRLEEIKTLISVHDAKATQYVERIVSTEERVADAVAKVADATTKISIVVDKMASNGNGHGFVLDRKTMARLIAFAIAGALALGGGNEIARRVFTVLVGPPSVVVEPEIGHK